MPKAKEPFKLSEDDLECIIDSLDDTAGFLIKKGTLKWLIEKIVNEDRERRRDAYNISQNNKATKEDKIL